MYVLFMNSDGTVRNSRKIASDTGGGPTLPASADFGRSIAVLGDLDSDGAVDLAVGAPDVRTVYILFLNSDGTVKRSATINGSTEGLSIPGSKFGAAVSAAGDLDGDGVQDLAVGAPGEPGAVHLLFMNSDGSVQSAKRIDKELGGGPILADRDTFGSSLAFLGDLDGDGIGDLSVGDPQRNAGGSVYVLLLNADGTVKRFQEIGNNVGGGPSLSSERSFCEVNILRRH